MVLRTSRFAFSAPRVVLMPFAVCDTPHNKTLYSVRAAFGTDSATAIQFAQVGFVVADAATDDD